MKIRTILFGALSGAGALMALAAPASAYVVCNREGDCWHTEGRYNRPGVSFEDGP